LRETQQAFLEAHADAFEYLGGIPGLVRYDNLTSAVKQVLRGRRRVETDRFVGLRSHYMFESQFTLIGLRGAHEKGGVEGEVGRFRRRHLVPVPVVGSLAELNAMLLAGCETDLGRQIAGRHGTVGEALARERPLLRALPSERAQTSEHTSPRVDSKAMVTVRQNRYSVPVGLVGLGGLAADHHEEPAGGRHQREHEARARLQHVVVGRLLDEDTDAALAERLAGLAVRLLLREPLAERHDRER
jgi:hypothetical protein